MDDCKERGINNKYENDYKWGFIEIMTIYEEVLFFFKLHDNK